MFLYIIKIFTKIIKRDLAAVENFIIYISNLNLKEELHFLYRISLRILKFLISPMFWPYIIF